MGAWQHALPRSALDVACMAHARRTWAEGGWDEDEVYLYCYSCALDVLHDLDTDEARREWLDVDECEVDDIMEELEKARDKHG